MAARCPHDRDAPAAEALVEQSVLRQPLEVVLRLFTVENGGRAARRAEQQPVGLNAVSRTPLLQVVLPPVAARCDHRVRLRQRRRDRAEGHRQLRQRLLYLFQKGRQQVGRSGIQHADVTVPRRKHGQGGANAGARGARAVQHGDVACAARTVRVDPRAQLLGAELVHEVVDREGQRLLGVPVGSRTGLGDRLHPRRVRRIAPRPSGAADRVGEPVVLRWTHGWKGM